MSNIEVSTNEAVALFRAKEAAKYLGIGTTKFYEIVKTGKIGAGLRFGCRCRVWRRQVLDEYINSLEREQQTEEE